MYIYTVYCIFIFSNIWRCCFFPKVITLLFSYSLAEGPLSKIRKFCFVFYLQPDADSIIKTHNCK